MKSKFLSQIIFGLALLLIATPNLSAQSKRKNKKTAAVESTKKEPKQKAPTKKVVEPEAVVEVEPEEDSLKKPKRNTWSATLYCGPTQFFGDLRTAKFWPQNINDATHYPEVGSMGFGATINKQVMSFWGLRAGLHAGGLKGYRSGVNAEIASPLYEAFFRTKFIQASLMADVNVKNLLLRKTTLPRWKFDVYGGLGFLLFDRRAYELGTPTVLGYAREQRCGANAPGSRIKQTFSIPTGFDVTFELSNRLDLGLNLLYNFTTTDILDGAKGGDYFFYSYCEPDNLPKLDKLKLKSLDQWAQLSIGLTYKIGKNNIRAKKKNGEYLNDPNKMYHLRWVTPNYDPPSPAPLPPDTLRPVVTPKPVKPPTANPDLPCNRDSDGDRIPDCKDKELNTPPNSIVDNDGVAIDMNKYNGVDIIPCDYEIFANVLFDTDKHAIKPQFHDVLSKVIRVLKSTTCPVDLSGHTDFRASDEYNIALSKRRVNAVKAYLINVGNIPADRIITDYYGERKPLAENATVEGMQQNRRVEMRLIPKKR